MTIFKKNPDSIRKRTNITLDPDVWERSQEICYSEGISVSELINQLLKMEITNDQEKKKLTTRKIARKSKD